MYSSRTGLTLAFHGCDKKVLDQVIQKKNKSLKASTNSWDWLGHGIYFWEYSPARALEFAKELSKKADPTIIKPAALGAVIDLGRCLDLLDYQNLAEVKEAYDFFRRTVENSEFPVPFPKNKAPQRGGIDLLIRDLDCAVIQTVHDLRKENGAPAYDSVRGVFWEGNHLYPDAGFREKDHIQICICNPNCIKGYFLPRDLDKDYPGV
jgi:hypothetical protein